MSDLEIQSNGYGICNQSIFNSSNNLVTNQYLKNVISNSNLIGEVKMYIGKTPPNGWLFCDGRTLLRTLYPDLSNVIGSTYGGDANNFNLPDFTSRVPICSQKLDTINIQYQGNSKYSGGNKSMDSNQLPSHSHTIAHTHNFNYSKNYYSYTGTCDVDKGKSLYQQSVPQIDTSATGNNMTDFSGNSTNTGSGSDFLPPFCVVNFIIYTGKL
jgi:microcystin-dependent protein